MTQLPPGVHPADMAEATGPAFGQERGLPVDQASATRNPAGRKPWAVPNNEALPVFQRGSHDWQARTYVVSGALEIAARVKGRTRVYMWVATGDDPVVVAPTQGEVNVYSGVEIAAGSSLTVDTEAPIWAGPVSGNTTGTVSLIALTNPSD